VSEPASISSGIAARYASAVFDLAKDGKAIAKLENNVDDLEPDGVQASLVRAAATCVPAA